MSTTLVVNADAGLSVDLYCGQDADWLTSAGVLETYNGAHLSNYAAPASESGGVRATGLYTADTGTPPADGWYWAFWTVRAGSQPDTGDFSAKFGRERLYWNGTEWSGSGAATLSNEQSAAMVAAIGVQLTSLIQSQLSAAVINVVGLVSVNSTLGPVVVGADYTVATGNAIIFRRATGVWTLLAGSTPTLRFRREADATVTLSVSGTYLDANGASNDGSGAAAVQFELHGEDTEKLTDIQDQAYEYDVVAAKAGLVVPLVNAGPVSVRWG